MPVTILDYLKLAKYNINVENQYQRSIGQDQLKEVIVFLEKGYRLNEDIQKLQNIYANAENAPVRKE